MCRGASLTSPSLRATSPTSGEAQLRFDSNCLSKFEPTGEVPRQPRLP
jgi:hypothetical protein